MFLSSFMNKTISSNRIFIVNGVNLSQLGTRETNIYGTLSFDEYLTSLKSAYPNVQFDYYHSDEVGELASTLSHATGYDGIILNAGAYTHTSIVLADAVRSASCPVIEVHISNLFGRELYRRESILSTACCGFICGFGLNSYRLAVEAILLKNKN